MVAENVGGNVVVMHGRKFVIRELDPGIAKRLLEVVAPIAERAETAVRERDRQTGESTPLSIPELALSFLTTASEEEIFRIGAAVLQFRDETEGVRWLKKRGLPLIPLAEALILTLERVDELKESLRLFKLATVPRLFVDRGKGPLTQDYFVKTG